MTNLLLLGDYVPDGAGGVTRCEGDKAMLAEALFRLTCRRGSFPFLPELGSRLHLLAREKPSARDMAARQYAAEALSGMDVTVTDASVTRIEDGAALIRVTLRSEDDEITVEVNT